MLHTMLHPNSSFRSLWLASVAHKGAARQSGVTEWGLVECRVGAYLLSRTGFWSTALTL